MSISMLQITLVYCVPNIMEVGKHLQKLQWNKKGERFLEHGVHVGLHSFETLVLYRL